MRHQSPHMLMTQLLDEALFRDGAGSLFVRLGTRAYPVRVTSGQVEQAGPGIAVSAVNVIPAGRAAGFKPRTPKKKTAARKSGVDGAREELRSYIDESVSKNETVFIPAALEKAAAARASGSSSEGDDRVYWGGTEKRPWQLRVRGRRQDVEGGGAHEHQCSCSVDGHSVAGGRLKAAIAPWVKESAFYGMWLDIPPELEPLAADLADRVSEDENWRYYRGTYKKDKWMLKVSKKAPRKWSWSSPVSGISHELAQSSSKGRDVGAPVSPLSPYINESISFHSLVDIPADMEPLACKLAESMAEVEGRRIFQGHRMGMPWKLRSSARRGMSLFSSVSGADVSGISDELSQLSSRVRRMERTAAELHAAASGGPVEKAARRRLALPPPEDDMPF